MHLLVVFLSIILVLTSAVLILLILVQLPKKEAGAGMAFGSGASDALFGAGSGNALTQMTKYAATIFLGLVIVLAFLAQRSSTAGARKLDAELKKIADTQPVTPLVVPGTTNQEFKVVSGNTNAQVSIRQIPSTNSAPISITPVAAPATTPAPAPAP